jgi:hypothetical protein
VVNVAQLQDPAVVRLPPSGESLLFAPDDPVLPGHPKRMAFSDHRWDYRSSAWLPTRWPATQCSTSTAS